MTTRSSQPFATALVLVLASLVGTLAIAALWADRQLLDDGAWATGADRVLGDGAVRGRVAVFLSDELADEAAAALAAEGEPGLAAEASALLRGRGPAVVDRGLRQPGVASAWRRANRRGRRAFVAALERDAGGTAGLELTPALRALARSAAVERIAAQVYPGGGEALAAVIPAGSGRIVVLGSEELETARDIADVIQPLPIPALLVLFGLYALALFLGRAALGRTLVGVGLSLLLAGVLALVLRELAGGWIVDALLAPGPDRGAGEAAWDDLTTTATNLSLATIVLGALLALGAGGLTAWRNRRTIRA